MSTVGQKEILTQKHVIKLFKSELGYTYLGYWKEREDNSNVEEGYLTDWLKRQGHSDNIITEVLHKLSKATALGGGKTLYAANREVHRLLRYGVKVKPDVGEQNITVWPIDWKNVENNDFAIAEEVTVAAEAPPSSTSFPWRNSRLTRGDGNGSSSNSPPCSPASRPYWDC